MKVITKLSRKICIVITLLSLFFTSCGARNNQGSVSGVAGEGKAGQEDPGQSAGAFSEKLSPTDGRGGTRAVADFNYIQLGSGLAFADWGSLWGHTLLSYAINGEWLYVNDFVEEGEGEGKKAYFGVTRNRIADGSQERNYVVTDVEITEESNKPLLLADRDGNCYLFWRLHDVETGTSSYALEKYGPDGGLLWRTEPDPGELEGEGERLEQGTVTRDGRILLYSYGAGGCVFCFGEGGSLDEVYRPRLRSLEGIAVGKEGRVYGYCVTGGERTFEILDGEGEQYDCPVAPLAVYDGYEEGLCLRTGEGMLAYDPETGEAQELWEWEDEYIQVDTDSLNLVFRDGGRFTLLCEVYTNFGLERQVAACASVTFGDSREYPGKQTVTLATDFASTTTEFLRRMYNRQSREYHVVSAPTKDEGILQKQLLRGEGADLMEVGRIHKGDLARHGAFEDLSPYYEGSQAVKEEDILEPVREACTIGGKNVAVIPSFRIDSMFDIGYSSAGDPWTVWKFLELGEGNRMFSSQSPSMALNYCMGIKHGEHFIDYEGRTCSFDGEEFRRILESCAKWEKYVEYSEDGHQTDGNIGQGDWLFGTRSVSGLGDILGIYRERCIGYPGWEGGEYPLQAYSVFAINSASKQKEGAWDFLEYLLSEETQELIWQMDGLFPARKDSFEDYLQYEYGFLGQKETKATEEDVDYLREMVGAAVFEDFGLDSVWGIVSEEAEMYFAGDATLDATVQKIQTRVQLYLDEL